MLNGRARAPVKPQQLAWLRDAASRPVEIEAGLVGGTGLEPVTPAM